MFGKFTRQEAFKTFNLRILSSSISNFLCSLPLLSISLISFSRTISFSLSTLSVFSLSNRSRSVLRRIASSSSASDASNGPIAEIRRFSLSASPIQAEISIGFGLGFRHRDPSAGMFFGCRGFRAGFSGDFRIRATGDSIESIFVFGF